MDVGRPVVRVTGGGNVLTRWGRGDRNKWISCTCESKQSVSPSNGLVRVMSDH